MTASIFLLLLLPSLAFPHNYPNTVVEHVGAGQSEILHCLLEGPHRQYCKVGWGEAFKKLKDVKINAPEAYGSALLIPEITETPFGPLTAKAVMQRLQGNLWTNWKITPTLNFVMDWNDSAKCWINGALKSTISVQANGKHIGTVEPGLRNYQFPLATAAGEFSWLAVSPLDSNQNRVKWDSQESDRAIFVEFDFVIRGGDQRFPFSIVPIPNSCRIVLSNVQTVFDRSASDSALDSMRAKALSTVELMVTEALHYATKIQGADGVKCVIARQRDSLRRSENIQKNENSRGLSVRSQNGLKTALEFTSHLTGYTSDLDAIAYLDTRHEDWLKSCFGQSHLGLDQFESVPANADLETRILIEKFLIHKATLQSILEDAWPLAVLLKIVNEDNRNLQWMIDSTVKYKLKSKDAP